jgi:hypothetical protein
MHAIVTERTGSAPFPAHFTAGESDATVNIRARLFPNDPTRRTIHPNTEARVLT